MFYKRVSELENLINEYKNAQSREDRLIKRRVDAIAACYAECNLDEREFADEIIVEFCRLISLLKEQHAKEKENIIAEYEEIYSIPEPASSNYIAFREEPSHYQKSSDLLDDFYNHFREEKTESTLKDYVARIYTFANRYLHELFSSEEIANSNSPDDIIFIYNNLEIIIARFNTKDENGKPAKQRVNIRSALRKLNDFKKMEKIYRTK